MFNSRKFVFKVVAILLVLGLSPLGMQQANGAAPSAPQRQSSLLVENATVAVEFGKTITFAATLKDPIPNKQVSILFRGLDEKITRVETVAVGDDGSVKYTYDASQNFFPPFSWVVFWFQATLADGQTYTSSPITFQYNDNRFPWREASRANVTVHWYAGDDAFGTAALDAAGAGLLAMNEVIPVSLDTAINVYIYSNVDDLKGTLELGGESWAGGHANPELGVVLAAIAPGSPQQIEMEIEIPHEITHVMLYKALGENYAKQPAWLLEGIASMVELYPNPDYARALEIASESESLLSFEDLCASFPADAGNAFLAYAQSQSFVSFIRNTYGNAGLARLMDSYGDGFSCELGATNALGTPLSQLDTRWRETVLGQNVLGVAARNLSPFILLMALVLVVPIWGAIDLLRQRRKRGQQSE